MAKRCSRTGASDLGSRVISHACLRRSIALLFLSRGAPLLSPSTGRDWNRNEITEATLIDATVLKAVLECKCVPAPRHPNVLLLGGDLVFWS